MPPDSLDPDTKRVHIRVEGVVQGVYFRASTLKEALRFNLTGWVRNTIDGAVEIEAQGLPMAVAALVAWCYIGSSDARVDKVDTRRIEVREDEESFEIHHL